MRKYIKWIFLIIFIIALIITIMLFVNFAKNRDNKDIDTDNKISQLFDKKWVRTGLSIYENNVLKGENLNLSDTRYIVFSNDFVSYCNNIDNECKDYYYEYNDEYETVFIDSEDYLVERGTYKITFYQNKFDLSLIYDEGTVIFHFDTPKG